MSESRQPLRGDAFPVAEVKRDFRRVLDNAERGRETTVLRHGKPVAVIGPVPTRSAQGPRAAEPGGILSIVGSLAGWEEIDADIAAIIAARQSTEDRPPPGFD
ncbi:MAG: type II toxin-antitoxin system Phd/YefM family antitoxin [Chloroflexota bacterium]|nr:MAG: type II toxin-antitoxin system Phd/YefM family antitoxin [Chloroflexota bacterium]